MRRKAQTDKSALEKELSAFKQNNDVLKQNTEVTSKFEQLKEQHVLITAQLTSDKEKLETSNNALKCKIDSLETILGTNGLSTFGNINYLRID